MSASGKRRIEAPHGGETHSRVATLCRGVLALLLAFGFCACVPSRPAVAGGFVRSRFTVDDVAQGGVALLGYRGIGGTWGERQVADQLLHRALHRAVPSLKSVSPQRVKEWLGQDQQLALGAALDEGPEFLPYDLLAPLGEKSRYFMWATVSRTDKGHWSDRDDDAIRYCTGWQLDVTYAIADLRLRHLVAEARIELDDQDCRKNPRSNTSSNASSLGGVLVGALVDTAADAAVDATFGTYPQAPALGAQLESSAAAFMEWLQKPHAARRTRRVPARSPAVGDPRLNRRSRLDETRPSAVGAPSMSDATHAPANGAAEGRMSR